MIIGIGCDIIEIARVEQALSRGTFRRRVFTEGEQVYCDNRGVQAAASFAARFAAKEALLKALGTGLRAGNWQEIEVCVNELGKPEILLSGYFAKLAAELGVKKIFLSLAHDRERALAYVIMEG